MANEKLTKAFKYSLSLLFLLINGWVCQAQDFDWGTALGVELNKKVTKKFNVGLSQEFRLNDQASNLYRSATQIGVEYSFFRKVCKAGLFGTYIRKENGSSLFESRYRLGADLSAETECNQFGLSWRTRLLSTWRDESLGSYKVNPKLSFRNRFQLEYKLFASPFKPYFSFEPFIYMNAQGGALFNNLRYRLGTSYRLNKRSSLDGCFRLDKEVQVSQPESFLSLDLSYKYRF
jgi:Protein of unknown function (DUF2490).